MGAITELAFRGNDDKADLKLTTWISYRKDDVKGVVAFSHFVEDAWFQSAVKG